MSETTLTTLEYALLGLLHSEPRSGYDISRLFAGTPLAHFSSSPGAIYPALKRLEQRKLVTATLDKTMETRPRRVYALAEAGQSALIAWLRQPVTRDEMIREGIAPLLRFSLAEAYLSDEEMVAYLEGFRQEVSGYLDELRGYYARTAESFTLPQRLALEQGIRGYECQADWIGYAIETLRRKRPGGA
jgi:DNA-binding PadR family transcriptional regulator